ncbi:Multiple epidermal growth factor-like domains protein 6 [Collichthys lucidus]|uniref:Multiple epidermal growth factor-like domains protein 6 n=1 Tax=Collichthys lucidus TaxID=240159 RepID=A0A4U5UBD7_COLLU|nr:Multiple epidermal growth factor-like domains protein 6 [Collichthys lucidus]
MAPCPPPLKPLPSLPSQWREAETALPPQALSPTSALTKRRPNVCVEREVTLVAQRQPCVQAFTRMVKAWKQGCVGHSWCMGYERRPNTLGDSPRMGSGWNEEWEKIPWMCLSSVSYYGIYAPFKELFVS